MTKSQSRKFSRLFDSHKMHLLALLGLFTDRNDSFRYPFTYFTTSEIPPPLGRSLPVYTIIEITLPVGMTFIAGNTVPICLSISFGMCFHTTLLTNYSIS